jgi:hypothetical protein
MGAKSGAQKKPGKPRNFSDSQERLIAFEYIRLDRTPAQIVEFWKPRSRTGELSKSGVRLIAERIVGLKRMPSPKTYEEMILIETVNG